MLGADINWLNDPTMAKVSVLLVNLWLGYPVHDAGLDGRAAVDPERRDGGRLRRRCPAVAGVPPRQVPAADDHVAPLLIASFAFNFNNFNVIYLLTRGGPPVAGFADARRTHRHPHQLHLPAGLRGRPRPGLRVRAAISVVIFIVVALISS
jgi:arabinogalactan oligomer / maltooligosaccharide transport system permease protein